jgi:two-component system chemotaxis response regulator CheY
MAERNQNYKILGLLAQLSVLVVEDSVFDRELAVATIKKIGIRKVHVAENGSSAVAKIQNALAVRRPFDIIFLDARMPVQDGVSLLKWIRNEPKLRDQIVIMTSASSAIAEVAELIDLGISSYVVKPLTVDVLQTKIYEALSLQKDRHAS